VAPLAKCFGAEAPQHDVESAPRCISNYPITKLLNYSMPLHIGIVACSAEGAALCYRTICLEGTALLGRHAHPEVSLHTHPLADYMRRIYADDWPGVAELMLSSAEKLARGGADFLICPDNTIHRAFELVAPRSPRPWLHIVEEVAAEARRQKFRRLALLGTRYTMEGPVYPARLQAAGIASAAPRTEERERIDQIIMDELVYARFTPQALAYFVQVIARLKDEGCDAVVLGCTEIPLLVTPEVSPLPTLDSTRILARAALQKAMGSTR
jgi:aspartate racemase